jgi:DNA-directed RNA polymerase specialized sigma24 family protein
MDDPHALLEHDDFLRALARGLVLDEARADDVVQQAWVAAIERGPDRPASLRAWLATAVRHIASKVRRQGARGHDSRRRAQATPSVRDRRARAGASPRRRYGARSTHRTDDAPAALLQRLPRAIAKRIGVPVETVRTRIKRSLEGCAWLDADRGGRGA